MEQALNPIGGMGSARPKNDHGVRATCGENHGLTEPVPPGQKSWTDDGGMGSVGPKTSAPYLLPMPVLKNLLENSQN